MKMLQEHKEFIGRLKAKVSRQLPSTRRPRPTPFAAYHRIANSPILALDLTRKSSNYSPTEECYLPVVERVWFPDSFRRMRKRQRVIGSRNWS